MKRLAFIILCLCAVVGAQAQTLQVGDRFFDGLMLYTIQEIRMDKYVYMVDDAEGEMTLEKVDGEPGVYELIPRPTSM